MAPTFPGLYEAASMAYFLLSTVTEARSTATLLPLVTVFNSAEAPLGIRVLPALPVTAWLTVRYDVGPHSWRQR